MSATKASTFRKTLTSASANLRVGDWQLSRRDLKLPPKISCSVRQRTLHGGKQEGVELIEVDNGALRFSVIPTRGMGVLSATLGDVRLGWDSPVKEVVHPQFINLASRGGLGWLEGFNEFIVRCGLESCGAPGPDTFRTATGSKATQDLPLHGKIANTPASEVEVVIDRTPPYRIRIRGRVDERMMFGPQFEMWTEISTVPGSNEFRVEDQIRNLGAHAQEFQLLYHVNCGAPLLEAGARFRSATKSVTPRNDYTANDIRNYDTFSVPEAGVAEQVYFIEPQADDSGRSRVMLHNAAADRGVSMEFDVDQLPCFSLWKNAAAIADGYVTGLEPGTGFPNPRRVEREAGRVPQLAPGETRRFILDFAIQKNRAQVASVAAGIDRIQKRNSTRIAR